MICPSCEVAFHEGEDTWDATNELEESRMFRYWVCMMTLCPECEVPIIRFEGRVKHTNQLVEAKVVYPTSATQVSVSPSVPEPMRSDYIEASNVLPISPKASAALSRRVLQAILSNNGYKGRDLAKQVEAVLDEKDPTRVLPLAIRNKVDAIRNFGNFSAHPLTDTTTLQIIDVESEGSEWCLEIITDLFEHYYVRPATDAKKLADLNQKLADAGKPPAK